MSLDYNVTKCVEAFDGTEDEFWAGPGQAKDVMVWYTLATDVGYDITDENVGEFIARIRFLSAIGSAIHAVPDGKEDPLTDEIIRAYVGMHTNVSPRSRSEWLLRVTGSSFFKEDDPFGVKCADCGHVGPMKFRVEFDEIDEAHKARRPSKQIKICPRCDTTTDVDQSYGGDLVMVVGKRG